MLRLLLIISSIIDTTRWVMWINTSQVTLSISRDMDQVHVYVSTRWPLIDYISNYGYKNNMVGP